MIDLDEIDTVAEETLVTLDDQIHGFEGKYVGKKEIKGSGEDETVYRVYFKPPESIFKSMFAAVYNKFSDSKEIGVEEYPEKIPESGLMEDVNTSNKISHNAKPDKKAVLMHKVDQTAPYAENKGEGTESEISNLKKKVRKWKQKARDAKREKTEVENESDLEDDTNKTRNPVDDFGPAGEYV